MGRVDKRAPVTIEEDVAADFARMGARVEVDAEDLSADTFDVWEENWASVCAFLDCQTQWRVAGFGGSKMLGLDYTAVDVVLRRTGADDGVFADLMVMEAAALKAFGEQD